MNLDANIVIPAIAFLIYSILESSPATRCSDMQKTSSVQWSHFDRKIWIEQPLSTIVTCFLAFSRFARWGFLIYYAFSTTWVCAVILAVLYFPVVIIFSLILETIAGKLFSIGLPMSRPRQTYFGRGIMTTTILPVLPILLILMYLSIWLSN